jgi:hypothetical protein
MDKGSPLNDLIRAIPVKEIETVLFLWSNEAFASALRHVRGDDDINASSECHGQSTLGRWAVIHPKHHQHTASGGGSRRCLVKTLLGAGPYWLLVNMLYYASRTSPLDLFTEAAVGFPTTVCMVSCNTPNHILLQFRQYRGTLPPSVHWLSSSVNVPVPVPLLLLLPNAEWWGKLLEITRIDSSLVPSDFDPDIDYLPRFHEAINDDDFI